MNGANVTTGATVATNVNQGAAVAVFDLASSQIIAEVVDGEAVILDMRSGCYFSTDGVGAEVWRAASSGVPLDVIVSWCRAAFPDQHTVESDIRAFLDSLLDARLLTPVELPRELPIARTGSDLLWPEDYAAPLLEPHSHLIDLVKMYL